MSFGEVCRQRIPCLIGYASKRGCDHLGKTGGSWVERTLIRSEFINAVNAIDSQDLAIAPKSPLPTQAYLHGVMLMQRLGDLAFPALR